MPTPKLIVVDASQDNTTSGITLAKDEIAKCTATGTWQIWGDGRACGPTGNGVVAVGTRWKKPGAMEGALLVYLDGNYPQPFLEGTFYVTGPGGVQFGPNYAGSPPRTGQMIVEMTVLDRTDGD